MKSAFEKKIPYNKQNVDGYICKVHKLPFMDMELEGTEAVVQAVVRACLG